MTVDTASEVVWKTYRGDKSGGVELESLQRCLLRFGDASVDIRVIAVSFTEWLGNQPPPWEVYYSLMAGRFIGLDNHPGVILVVDGETWQHMMKK